MVLDLFNSTFDIRRANGLKVVRLLLVEQHHFYDYQMPRITDIPPIEVHIMENDEDAGGIGEPGLPPFAPALTEAIFDLTGKRIRKLPFDMASI